MKISKAEEKEMLNLDMALDFLTKKGYRLTKTTAYILNSAGKFAKGKKIGKSLFFTPDDLLNWTRERGVASSPKTLVLTVPKEEKQ